MINKVRCKFTDNLLRLDKSTIVAHKMDPDQYRDDAAIAKSGNKTLYQKY
jgi:hypothetical protein